LEIDAINHMNEETPEELAKRLKLPFKNMLLLRRSLTHRSYINEHPESLEDNERLEFLGDAILDFLVGEWLYHRYPEMPEGDLTRMRSALVHTEQLADFARKLELGRGLRLGRGEILGGGRERDALLCDEFEALVGALYIDSGLNSVKEFLYPILERAALDIIANHKTEDPKSMLQEWAQAQGYETPAYVTCSVEGPDHSREFEVKVLINENITATGRGKSKQAAEKNAARELLKMINIGQ
jgi:ribonuclease III